MTNEVCASTAVAQLDPPHTPGTPGDGIPDFRFDAATGLMTFNADGIGVLGIILEGPDPGIMGLLNPDGNWPDQTTIVNQMWTVINTGVTPTRILSGGYVYFEGTYQNVAFTDTADTGWNNTTDLAIIQYPAGVRLSDFGEVVVGTYPTGPILTTAVVPEPGGLAGLVIFCLGAFFLRRARRTAVQAFTAR